MNALVPLGATVEHLPLDGGRVRLLTGGTPGTGTPLVLLHGAGAGAAISWYRVFAPLGTRYRVIAIDMPGFGGTTGIEPARGGRALAGFVARVMHELGLGDAVIVGASMGGEVALNLALHHPQLVRALVLVSPAGLLPVAGNPVTQFVGWLSTRLPERVLLRLTRPPKLDDIVHDPAVLPPELIDGYRREAARPGPRLAYIRQTKAALGWRTMRNNLLPQVGRIAVPTLFVHGADDRIVPPETSRQAAHRMPAARRVVVPDCGHWAQLEAHDRFLAELARFVTRAGRARATASVRSTTPDSVAQPRR